MEKMYDDYWTNVPSNEFEKETKERLEHMVKDAKEWEKLEKNLAFKESVNHPSHYNRDGGMECLDEMELIFGKEAVMNFCLCNAWKYRYRAADKNGEEDLKKSDWYLKKYKELKEGKNTTTVTIPKGYHSVNTMLGTVTVKDVLGKND